MAVAILFAQVQYSRGTEIVNIDAFSYTVLGPLFFGCVVAPMLLARVIVLAGLPHRHQWSWDRVECCLSGRGLGNVMVSSLMGNNVGCFAAHLPGNIKKARGILANQLKICPNFVCLWRVAISLEESEKQYQQARWLYGAGASGFEKLCFNS